MKKHTTMAVSQPNTGKNYALLKKSFYNIFKGMNIHEVFDFAHSIMGNSPHLISEASVLFVSRNSSFSNTSFLDMLRTTAEISNESLYVLETSEYLELRKRSYSPIIIDCSHLGLRLLTMSIRYKGAIIADLLLPESEKIFDQSDTLYLQLLAEYISELLLDESSEIYNALFFQNNFKKALLSEESCDICINIPDDLMEKNKFVACINPSAEQIASYYEKYKGNAWGLHFCRSIIFEESIVYLCIPENDEQELAMKKFFVSIAEAGVPVGISAGFTSCKNIFSHFCQAAKMAEYAEKRGLKKVMYFFDHLAELFISEAADYLQLENYIDENFKQLKTAGGDKGSYYLETLLTYYECNANKQDACNRMGLHRNTFSNRVSKIESVLKHSLDPDEKMFYYLLMELVAEIINFDEEKKNERKQ